MAVFVNPRDQLLQAASPRVVPIPIDPNSIPGLPGAIAASKGIRISAPSTVFQISVDGTASPASISLTAILTNISGTVVWSIQNGTATLTGTGNVRTLASANMASPSVTVRAMVSFEGSDYIADYTVAKVADGTNGTSGTPGTNTSLVYAYIRSATAPTTNPGQVTWTFNVAAITTPTTLPNGWTKTIPAGTDPIYVTIATASSSENTDIILANEWTTPVILGSQGTNGINSSTVWLFTRSNSTTPPATPAGNLTLNFSTGLLTGTLGIWSQTVPLVAGMYLYASTATAAGTSGTVVIPPTAWATASILAKDGDDGDAQRGSLDLIGTLATLTAYPTRPGGLTLWSQGTPSAANATAADNYARDIVWQALGNSGSALNNSHMRMGDKVTLKNTSESVVVTGYWGGSAWMHPGTILDGNLLVPGTVSASKIDSRGLTIRMADGTIVLDASRRLNRSDLTDLGALAALNSISLGSPLVVGNLPSTSVSGLGALAILNSVNLNSQTTGALNGLTQVTNLGGLAYANAVAAEQIGAGAVTAGKIFAGAVTTTALAAGAVTADKMAIGVSGNILPNSTLVTTAGWGPGDDILGGTQSGRNLLANYTPTGGNCLQIYQSSAGNTSGYSYWISDFFAVDPLTRYEFSVLIGAYGCTAQAYMEVYDAGITTWLGSTPLATNAREKIGGKSLGEFKLLFGFLDVPGNAAVGRLIIRKNHTEVGPDSLLTITRPMVARASSAQTVPSLYSATGQGTVITAAGISTPSLGAISQDLGLVVRGRMVSTDGMMTVDMDNKSVTMVKNGRRVALSSDGFYFGPDNYQGNRLEYNLNSGALVLNGAFTSDALNVVNTANISGGAVTSMQFAEGVFSEWYTPGAPVVSAGLGTVNGMSGIVITGTVEVIISGDSNNWARVKVFLVRNNDGATIAQIEPGLFTDGNTRFWWSISLTGWDRYPYVPYAEYSVRVFNPAPVGGGQVQSRIGRSTITLTGGKR